MILGLVIVGISTLGVLLSDVYVGVGVACVVTSAVSTTFLVLLFFFAIIHKLL